MNIYGDRRYITNYLSAHIDEQIKDCFVYFGSRWQNYNRRRTIITKEMLLLKQLSNKIKEQKAAFF